MGAGAAPPPPVPWTDADVVTVVVGMGAGAPENTLLRRASKKPVPPTMSSAPSAAPSTIPNDEEPLGGGSEWRVWETAAAVRPISGGSSAGVGGGGGIDG